jgi:hypothetical protein
MKLDPGMHIGMHLVFFGKSGVTQGPMIKAILWLMESSGTRAKSGWAITVKLVGPFSRHCMLVEWEVTQASLQHTIR